MSAAICFNVEKSKILSSGNGLTLYYKITNFNSPVLEAFENFVKKGENAGTQQFLFFSQCFLPPKTQNAKCVSHVYFVVCKCFQFGPVQHLVVL